MRCTLVVLGVLAAAGLAREAAACSCSGPSSCRTYGRADAVFVGDVVEIHKTAGPRRTTVQMRVIRIGKGAVDASQIVTVEAPFEDSSCGMGLEAGQRWMVFAAVSGGSLVMNPCAGSHRLGLDERLPDLPPRGGTIHGRLLRPWSSGENERRGIADAAVWIDNPDGRLSTRTEAGGAFTLTGVRPGSWNIHFDVGPEQSANAWIELDPGQDCFDVRAVVRPAGALSGSVVDEQGAPLVGAPITVTAADDDEDTPAYQTITDERGGFDLPGVSPGVYLVRAGEDGEERGQFPYRPQFYQTARDRASAKTVEVRGTTVRIGPIVMRGALPTVRMAVEIVCSDGTRPAHAYARAERADGQHEFTTPVDATARRVVRVFPGQHYLLGGAVRGRLQALDGSLQVAWVATTKAQVDPARSSGVHLLLANVRGCDAPGGPWIDAR